MFHLAVPFAASSTGFVQRRKLVSVPCVVRKAHVWCFDLPRTLASETWTRDTFPAAVMPFAPLQPLSREVRERGRRRREVWGLPTKRVTGAILSLQLPPVPPAVGRPAGVVFSQSVGPPVWVET